MKKLILVIVTVLIMAGCSARNQSSQFIPDQEFFSREIKGEITISAYQTITYGSFLEEAIKAFNEIYPNVTVHIETFAVMPETRTMEDGEMMVSVMQSSDDPQTRADYINRTNTRIMSGQGADLYAIDILPLHRMIKSGVLENLDPYMNSDPGFNKSDYRLNILDAVHFLNGKWFIPLDYSINYYAYDSTLVPENISGNFGVNKSFTLEELIRITSVLYNGTGRIIDLMDYSQGGGSLHNMLLYENYRSFVNLETGKPNFLDGKFASMLNLVKNYGEQGFVHRSAISQESIEQMLHRMMTEPAERFYLKRNSDMNLLFNMSRENGIGSILRSPFVIDDDDEIAGIAANADGSVPFIFQRGFLMNSQSKNKEAAWTFIKFLLSKEMQMSLNTGVIGMVLPIHNEARDEKGWFAFSGEIYSMNIPINDQMRTSFNHYRNTIETLSDSINTFLIRDTNINDMIAQEVQYFFDGSRTAEEVARVLQNKADLYLSE